MGAHMCESPGEHEPLLVHVSATGTQRRGRPFLKFVISAVVMVFLISASVLAFSALVHGRHEDQRFQIRKHVINDVGLWFLTGYGSEINASNWTCLCEVMSGRLTTFQHKIGGLILTHANVQKLAIILAGLMEFRSPIARSIKHDQVVDGIVAPQEVEMPSSGTHVAASISAASKRLSKGARRRSHTLRKVTMISFLKIAQDLSREGVLQSHQKILCLDSSAGQKVRALKKRGFKNVEGIDVSLVGTLADQSFDFTYTTVFDQISEPALFVAEIERISKVGGFAAMHVSLNAWRNKYIRSKPGDGMKPVTMLFKNSKIVYVSTAYAPGLDTIIVFKRMSPNTDTRHGEKTKGADQAAIDGKQLNGHAFLSKPFLGS